MQNKKKEILYVGNVGGIKTQGRSVYLTEGICPTLTAGMSHGNTMPYIIEEVENNMNEELKPKRIGNIYGEDKGTSFAGNCWSTEDLSPTITTAQGGNRQPLIIEDFYSNRDERVYDEYSPAIRSERSGLKVLEENNIGTPKVLGGLGEKKSNGGTQYYQQDRVYDSDGIAMCHPANIPGGSYRYLIDEGEDKEVMQAAIRGRYTGDGKIEQQLELRDDDVSKTITTVQKDNMLLEQDKIKISQATKKGYIEMENGGVADLSFPTSKKRRGRVQGDGNICPTLPTSPNGIHKIDREFISNDMTREELIKRYRIRKLTEREVWRIMNFSDEDFDKAAQVNSATQLYKEAGNAIIENVLVALFGQLFDGKEDTYKERAKL
jgi:DNA (cytosine-5)-methyltransferase 1